MATVDNEKYLRIILLLAKGGTLVVREVFARELAAYIAQHGGNLDTLLQNYENNIKKRKYLSRPQCLKLFPPTGMTNLQQWDIGLLVFATLHVFGTSLSPTEKFEIRQIQFLRNGLAHSPDAELDSSSYQAYLLILQNAIRTLAAGFGSTNIKTETEQLLNDCENGSLDIKSTLKHLQEIKEKEELFQEVLEKFEKLEEVSNRNTDIIISRVNEVGEELQDKISQNAHMIANLQSKLEQFIQKDGICTKIIQLIGTKIRVEGTDDEVTTLIEEIVIDVINEAEKKTFGSKDISAIKEAVKQILSDMKCDGENDVLYAKKSCIFVWVRCNTYKGLRGMLEYVGSTLISQRLDKLSEAVRTSLSFSCKFTCNITPSSLRSLQTRLYAEEDVESERSPVTSTRSITVPIQCKTILGLSRIWDIVEGGAAQQFENLSHTISNVIGSKVSVTASVDFHEFSEAVQKIETFESEVNELFTNLRNWKSMMTVPSAISLSADSGVSTSLGHRREESWSHDAGGSFVYNSEVSCIVDKRPKTFKDILDEELYNWSEYVLTDIDRSYIYIYSEECTHPAGQHIRYIREGSDLKIPPLLLPKLPLPFFHWVKKTPRHTDLSFYVCEAFDDMDIDMIRKSSLKLMHLLDSKHRSEDIQPRLVFKSSMFPFASMIDAGFDIVFQLPRQLDTCIDTYPKIRNDIEAAGYAFIEPPSIWHLFSFNTYGPAVLKTLYDHLCIKWPAYAREHLFRQNASFSESINLNLLQHKCTVKQVQSEYSPFLWRYTFKFQERYLIEQFNDLQWKCLISMGILLIDKHAVLDNEVLCMSLFYTIERVPPEIWNKREHFLGCLIQCLCTLSQFMENNFVPNFLWPTNNILLETISTEERKRIVDEITYIIENPFETLFSLPWAQLQNEVREFALFAQYLKQMIGRLASI